MAETDPGKLADHLEREADDLEQQRDKLAQRTEDAAQEWQRKRSDPNVPGAKPPDEEEADAPPTGAPSGKGDDAETQTGDDDAESQAGGDDDDDQS
jgi:hypothetical protein